MYDLGLRRRNVARERVEIYMYTAGELHVQPSVSLIDREKGSVRLSITERERGEEGQRGVGGWGWAGGARGRVVEGVVEGVVEEKVREEVESVCGGGGGGDERRSFFQSTSFRDY